MSDDQKPPCAVCKGEYDEHFDGDGKRTTQHVYTETPGDLTTPKQRQKEQILSGVGGNGQRVPIPASMVPSLAGNNPLAMGRLVEVLLDRGMLTPQEALYIGGMGPKPEKQQYRDPAALTGGN